MGRTIYSPKPPTSQINGIVPIERGGTGADTIEQAAINLHVLDNDNIGQPLNPIVLDGQAKVPTSRLYTNLPGQLISLDSQGEIPQDKREYIQKSGVTVTGPSSLFVMDSGTYTITNFDITTTYDVKAVSGSISTLGDTISYTAPSSAGIAGFTINGKRFTVQVLSSGVNKPTITSPTLNTTKASGSLSAFSSSFSFVGTTETHDSSDWQLSTQQDFSSVFLSVLNSQTALTSVGFTGVHANTTYYVRVRHKGTRFGYSQWSDPVAFNTADITIDGPSTIFATQSATFNITNYSGSIVYNVETTGDNTVTRSNNLVSFTAGSQTGEASFSVNGKTVPLTILASRITTPSITSPVQGFNQAGASVTFTSSDFLYEGVSDTHKASSWQLATDSSFLSIVATVSNNTTNLTSWVVESLVPDTTYYVRVKHTGERNGSSEWSAVSSLRTRANFYPLNEIAKIISPDTSTYGVFGTAVALSSDGSTLAITGVSLTSSFVYVYQNQANAWNYFTRLRSNNAPGSGLFGRSLALSYDGRILAIGCEEDSGNKARLYIYEKSPTTYTEKTFVEPTPDLGSSGQFASVISMNSAGTVIAASAKDEYVNAVGESAGVVYIISGSGVTYDITARLSASDATTSALFGSDLELSSNAQRLVVGAPGANAGKGSFYVFDVVNSTYSQSAILNNPSPDANIADNFGTSLSLSGDGSTITCGIDYDSGAKGAYVYTLNTTWQVQAKLTSLSNTTGDKFTSGSSGLASSYTGNFVMCGANGLSSLIGSSIAFSRTGATWQEYKQYTPTDTTNLQQFGFGVHLNRDATIAAISSNQSELANPPGGAVYIFG